MTDEKVIMHLGYLAALQILNFDNINFMKSWAAMIFKTKGVKFSLELDVKNWNELKVLSD